MSDQKTVERFDFYYTNDIGDDYPAFTKLSADGGWVRFEDYERLEKEIGIYRERTNAWHAVVAKLLSINKDLFANPETGRDAVLLQIDRFQSDISKLQDDSAALRVLLAEAKSVVKLAEGYAVGMKNQEVIADFERKLRAALARGKV